MQAQLLERRFRVVEPRRVRAEPADSLFVPLFFRKLALAAAVGGLAVSAVFSQISANFFVFDDDGPAAGRGAAGSETTDQNDQPCGQ